MKRDLTELGARQFDVVVVGGGVLGASVARDAALRGLKLDHVHFYLPLDL